MTEQSIQTNPDNVDVDVDKHLVEYLTADTPKSFFLFAGAGSGKTRSLVSALEIVCATHGDRYRKRNQSIGVITYTNAACDEIIQRLNFNPLIEVSTIHSFIWTLISPFNSDIKSWLETNLQNDIKELQELQSKGRAGKASLDRAKSIEAKQKRLSSLSRIKKFTYNPNGNNIGQDSLNHNEVIEIGAYFLIRKPLMQDILIGKFPILLIDESQDTIKSLMDAFLEVQQNHSNRFALGLFGDTMQRIYGHGKEDLGRNLPSGWESPAKKMNHRSPHRIIRLINKIRSAADPQQQDARADKPQGIVRVFVLPHDIKDKTQSEEKIKALMAEITKDPLWTGANADVKTLTLEHHMAANRMGFSEMFSPLYEIDSFRTGLLDGSLPGITLFSQQVLPLVTAIRNNDEFAAMAILRKYSPYLSKATLEEAGQQQLDQITKAKSAVVNLLALWKDSKSPTFSEVLRSIADTHLFEIPESLSPIALRNQAEQAAAEKPDATTEDDTDNTSAKIDAWDKFLATPFDKIESYQQYVTGKAHFGTHQGVKGLEFSRVMVIMADAEARGFLFSYDKLLGVKGKTTTDLKNEKEGKETGIDRTRRLFYVTCSRAKDSLAIVIYSDSPEAVKENVVREGWFETDEVILST